MNSQRTHPQSSGRVVDSITSPATFHGAFVVYFIQGECTRLVKIGKTTSLVKRLRELQTCSPDRLTVLGTIADAPDDAPYHFQFRTGWHHAEWFEATPELMAFIETLEKPFATRCEIRNVHLQTPRTAVIRKALQDDRALLAEKALEAIHAAKPGSHTQVSFMKLYARLRGWKSWKDVRVPLAVPSTTLEQYAN